MPGRRCAIFCISATDQFQLAHFIDVSGFASGISNRKPQLLVLVNPELSETMSVAHLPRISSSDI